MAEQFNPAEWVPVTQQQQAPAFNEKEWVTTGNAIDPKTPFAGLTSAQPLNKSDLDLTDRFKMGFGNQKGNIEYLKQKGYDAKLNDKGDLVYRKKDDMMWRYADEKDSWSLSETVKDVADAVPEITTFAAQTGATMAATALTSAGIIAAPLTGGASTVGSIAASGALMGVTAGLTKAASTSFGRYLNTYQASPEEQVMDVMMESALNFGAGSAGKALELGAKPTVKFLSDRMTKAGEFVKNGGEAAKGTMAFLIKNGLSVTDDAAEFAANNLAEVGAGLSKFPSTASKSAIKQATDLENITLTKKLAASYKEAASIIYKEDEEFIKKAAEVANLKIDPVDLTESVLNSIGKGRGLFKWTVDITDDTGKAITVAEPSLKKALAMAGGNKEKLGLELVNDSTIGKLYNEALDIGDSSLEKVVELLSNETGRRQLHSGVSRVVKNLLSLTEKEGSQSATALIRYNKLIRRQLKGMSEVASSGVGQDRNLALANFFDDMYFDAGTVFSKILDPVSHGRFSQMNNTHRALRQGTKMFEDAAVAHKKDPMAYAKLYSQLRSNSTLGTYRNMSLAEPEALIKTRAPQIAKEIDRASHQIDLNLTMQDFSPWVTAKTAGYVAPAVGIAVGTGTVNPLLGLGAAALATSPRLAAQTFGAAARLANGVKPTPVVSQLAQSKEAINGLRIVKGMSSLLKPDAIKAGKATATATAFSELMNRYMVSPFEQQQMKDQLLQQGGIR